MSNKADKIGENSGGAFSGFSSPYYQEEGITPPRVKKDIPSPQAEGDIHAEMKLNPLYIEKYVEKKCKRVQLVMKPSTVERAKERAREKGLSLNDYIHRLVEEDTKGE